MNKITSLSIAVIVLSLFNILITTIGSPKTYFVSVYLEGEKSGLTRVADLSIDFDKKNLELVSSEAGGFLVGSSSVRKNNWKDGRFLLMSTTVDQDKPILKLEFKLKNKIDLKTLSVSPKSSVYIAQTGPVSLPSEGLSYRIKYE